MRPQRILTMLQKTMVAVRNEWANGALCKEHNRVLAKFHLEKLGLPLGITDYQNRRILPTQAQLAKCYADAERQMAEKGGGEVMEFGKKCF